MNNVFRIKFCKPLLWWLTRSPVQLSTPGTFNREVGHYANLWKGLLPEFEAVRRICGGCHYASLWRLSLGESVEAVGRQRESVEAVVMRVCGGCRYANLWRPSLGESVEAVIMQICGGCR